MIACSWHGRVPTSKADAYYRYLLQRGLADYRATPGNRDVYVFPRTEGEITHRVLPRFGNLLTRFELLRVPTTSESRYYPEDDEYLLEREPYVTHVLASVGDQAA